MISTPADRSDRRRVLASLLLVVVVAMLGAGRVAAHSDLESTSPEQDAVVTEAVGEIEVVFTSSVQAAGAGFEVLDPQGEIREPDVEAIDDRTFVLRLNPPLAGGTVGVRYAVTAADGHSLTGGFAFVVEAEAPPPTTAPATVPPTTTSQPPTTVVETTEPAPTSTSAAPAPTDAPAPTEPPTTSAPDTTVAASAPPGEADADASDDPDRIGAGVVGALALAVAGGVGGGVAVRRNGSRPS